MSLKVILKKERILKEFKLYYNALEYTNFIRQYWGHNIFRINKKKKKTRKTYWQKQSLKALLEGKRIHDPAVSQQYGGARRECENTTYWGFNNTEMLCNEI